MSYPVWLSLSDPVWSRGFKLRTGPGCSLSSVSLINRATLGGVDNIISITEAGTGLFLICLYGPLEGGLYSTPPSSSFRRYAHQTKRPRRLCGNQIGSISSYRYSLGQFVNPAIDFPYFGGHKKNRFDYPSPSITLPLTSNRLALIL